MTFITKVPLAGSNGSGVEQPSPASEPITEAGDTNEVHPGSLRVGDFLVDCDHDRVAQVSGPRHDWDGWTVRTTSGASHAWDKNTQQKVRVQRGGDVPPSWLTPTEQKALRSIARFLDNRADLEDRDIPNSGHRLARVYRADAALLRDLVRRLTDG